MTSRRPCISPRLGLALFVLLGGCESGTAPAPLDVSQLPEVGAADAGARDAPALILHARPAAGGGPRVPALDCERQHPVVEATPGREIDVVVFVRVPEGTRLAGMQVAFEWPSSWEYLGWSGAYARHALVAAAPVASGARAGTLALAFDCVAAGVVVPIGHLAFRPGPSGCLRAIASSYPYGSHVVTCESEPIAIPAENWGSICAGARGTDPCGTNAPPTDLGSPAPANGLRGVPARTDLDLAWQGGADPEGRGVVYRVYFGTRDPLALLETTGSRTARVAASRLAPRTTYKWRVEAIDPEGAKTAGSAWSFATGDPPNLPPSAPEAPSPANGATGITTRPTLRWSGGIDPERERVQFEVFLDTVNPPARRIATVDGRELAVTSRLAAGATHYWRVVARDRRGNAAPGPVWSFATSSRAR